MGRGSKKEVSLSMLKDEHAEAQALLMELMGAAPPARGADKNPSSPISSSSSSSSAHSHSPLKGSSSSSSISSRKSSSSRNKSPVKSPSKQQLGSDYAKANRLGAVSASGKTSPIQSPARRLAAEAINAADARLSAALAGGDD